MEEDILTIKNTKNLKKRITLFKEALFKPGISDTRQDDLLDCLIELGLPYDFWECLARDNRADSNVIKVASEEMTELAVTLLEHVGLYFVADLDHDSDLKKVSFQVIEDSFASSDDWKAVLWIAKQHDDEKLEEIATKKITKKIKSFKLG